MYNLPCLGYNGGLYMNLFEKSDVEKEKPHLPSIEIFARKKSRASKRYGTKRPDEKTNQQELLTAWREDL
jgi:hypothetical protein